MAINLVTLICRIENDVFPTAGFKLLHCLFFPAEVSPLPSCLHNANEVLLVTHSLFSIAVSHINPGYDQGLSEKLCLFKNKSKKGKLKKKLTSSHKSKHYLLWSLWDLPWKMKNLYSTGLNGSAFKITPKMQPLLRHKRWVLSSEKRPHATITVQIPYTGMVSVFWCLYITCPSPYNARKL